MSILREGPDKPRYRPRNYRIISHRTQRRILHIEDALELERIRLEMWDYSKGAGAKGNVEAYLDHHTARLLAVELASGTLTEMDGRQEMGGVVAQGEVISRSLGTENTDTKNPIRITIRNGPGVRQPSGLISPATGQSAVSLSVLLSTFDARRIGLALLEHLQAWAVSTYSSRIRAGTWQPSDQTQASAARDSMSPGEPVGEPGPMLLYGNGDPVSDNPAEIQAYIAFLRTEREPPLDVDALRIWVRLNPHPPPGRS
jgi:hypothetical protein